MNAPKIQVLPPDVVGQIAAGEVVERPAAAIKDLVENSLDAGATSITVDIKEGGLSSFRVIDNGSGINPADIRLAFERHATSKIRTAEDLYGVKSLGFRGEALSSIAAVAKVTCLTRMKGQDSGLSVQNDGGQITDMRDAACPEGTSFTVKDLFFNAPVRRKFLKKPATETAAVSELMARLILSHPEISFRYMTDGKTVYFSAGDGKVDSAVMSIYTLATLKQLTKVEGNMNGICLSGLVGVGDAARGNRSHQHFFINGRTMKSPLLTGAVENACRQRVTIGRFPLCVLYLTLPYQNVDVNVHPNKWDVRFSDEAGVKAAVEMLVLEALNALSPQQSAPQLFEDKPAAPPAVVVQKAPPPVAEAPVPVHNPLQNPLPPVIKRSAPTSLRESPFSVPAPRPVPVPKVEIPPPPAPVQVEEVLIARQFESPKPRLIGTAFLTYVLVECGNDLFLCDQHAVHERILYEKFMREIATAPASQAMLIPCVMELSRSEYEVYEQNTDALVKAGFDLEPFGGSSVQLRGVPLILGQPEAERCLRDALDELSESGTLAQADRVTRIVQMACKHAVKGGEPLPTDALMELVQKAMSDSILPTCPHGRPLMIRLTRQDLEKRFKRIQN